MTDAATGPRACFATLGIPPTGDARAIKRAYAGVLKTIDLATEPDRFARLRADYEAALALASRIGDDAPVAVPVAVDIPVPPGDGGSAAAAAIIPPGSTPRWNLRAVSPRHRVKPAVKPLADVDNHAEWVPAMPPARMPPAVSALRDGPPPGAGDDGESGIIAALLDDLTPGRAALLDAGLRRYGWDMVGTDLGGFGAQRDWLTRLLEERARWQAMDSRARARPEALLARIAAAPPDGSAGDLYSWLLFADTLKAYPLWTAFVAGSYRLDQWHAAGQQASAWKKCLVRIRRKPLLVLFLTWILIGFLPVPLMDVADMTGPAGKIIFMIVGAVQTVLLILMIAMIGTALRNSRWMKNDRRR